MFSSPFYVCFVTLFNLPGIHKFWNVYTFYYLPCSSVYYWYATWCTMEEDESRQYASDEQTHTAPWWDVTPQASL